MVQFITGYWQLPLVVLSFLFVTILADSNKSYNNSKKNAFFAAENKCSTKRNLEINENIIDVDKKSKIFYKS